MRNIGKNIRSIREQKKMTQEELAEQLFVTRQTVSNYETGKSKPDVETLLQIAHILSVDVNALIYGPPVPEDRRKSLRWLIISGATLVSLAVIYIALLFVYKHYERELFYVPLHFGNFTVRPLFCFVLGWMLLHIAGMACKWKLPAGKVVRVAGIVLSVLIGFVVVAVFPFAVWLLLCMIKSITQTSVNMTFPTFPVYHQFLQLIVSVFMKYPFVCALFGGLCWLLNIPRHQKTPADH